MQETQWQEKTNEFMLHNQLVSNYTVYFYFEGHFNIHYNEFYLTAKYIGIFREDSLQMLDGNKIHSYMSKSK